MTATRMTADRVGLTALMTLQPRPSGIADSFLVVVWQAPAKSTLVSFSSKTTRCLDLRARGHS
jgi:hypothetical protein